MTIELSKDARGSLDAICDTFAPGENGLPSATEIHVPDVILGAMGANPSADARDGFAGLIEGWDSGFASLPREEREQALLAWCDSDDVMQRAAFQALRKLTMVMYYTIPWQGGQEPDRRGDRLPGPHGKPRRPQEEDRATVNRRGHRLDCDVSWSAPAPEAGWRRGARPGRPRRRGRRGGRLLQRRGLRRRRARRLRALYLGGGGVPTPDQSMGLLAGFCLGGGTTVNYTWCFRPPDHVREDWRDRFGLSDWMGADFDDSLDAVWERLHVNSENSMPSLRDERFREGLAELGWDSQVMQRNAVGCREDICGQCHYGCPIGAKQSTMVTWLQDAYDAGARIVVNAMNGDGQCCGQVFEATTADGHRITAAGRRRRCDQPPALLVRSGLDNPNVGRT